MARIALYARVSTNQQSSESQLNALNQYCRDRALTIHDTYIDIGISGSKSTRPELNRLMRDAFLRKFDLVVVFRFDRFARSTSHLLKALKEFKTYGIGFVSLSESIDTSTPLGEAVFTIVAAISQLERDIIRERVVAGLANAKAKGKRLGRPKRGDADKINELRCRGYSVRHIARALGISRGAVASKVAIKPAELRVSKMTSKGRFGEDGVGG